MNKKCIGCGALLQTEDSTKKGYTTSLEKEYCMRCFRWNHYKDFTIGKEKITKEEVISKLNKEKGLIFFFLDFLNLHEEALEDFKQMNHPKVLVVTKLDTIPKSIYLEKIRMWLKKNFQVEEVLFVQKNSKKSLKKIESCILEKQIKNVYFAGITNAGKSTFLNAFLDKSVLTVSEMPNTTLDFLKMKLGDFFLYDTPGIPYASFVSVSPLLEKANVQEEIKPRNYPLKKEASLVIENEIRIHFSIDNNVTFFGSKNLQIQKIYDKNQKLLEKKKVEIEVMENSNLYIKGLGFFYIKKPSKVFLYGVEEEQLSVLPSFLGE